MDESQLIKNMYSILRRVVCNQIKRRYSNTAALEQEQIPNNVSQENNKINDNNNNTKKKLDLHEKSLNVVHLIGRVNSETQEKTSKKGKVTIFSLKTTNLKLENKVNSYDWHRIVVFNPPLQTYVHQYVSKEDRVHVTGKIHYHLSRDKTNGQRFITSIIADKIMLLSKDNRNE